MSAKSQNANILLAAFCLIMVMAIVALIGFLTLGNSPEIIQGQVEVTEYRVSSKVPGRILEIRVKEGDKVHKGDTLVILEAPDILAKRQQAEAVESAASAMNDMASSGARQEQIQAAYQLWQQAKAGAEIAEKSYHRVQRLFEEGVVSAQKADEAAAQYKALQAQENAAKSQYEMAVAGARQEEKRAAQAQLKQAKGVVEEVSSYIDETIQIAQMDGEVSEIYPKLGELIGTGSPIMTIALADNIWGTFNVREDLLKDIQIGSTFNAYVPAFDKEIEMKVFYMKDEGSYAVWKATKANGQYDLKTFEVRAHPTQPLEGLRAGMSLIVKK